MSEDNKKQALIKEANSKLQQVLKADHLSEEQKVSVLKEILALTANERNGGSGQCQM